MTAGEQRQLVSTFSSFRAPMQTQILTCQRSGQQEAQCQQEWAQGSVAGHGFPLERCWQEFLNSSK